MSISISNFEKILHVNVLELVFVRRRKADWTSSPTRRMLCTLSGFLLNSDFGIKTLNFKRAKHSPSYNATTKNLITVWDVMMQDWRNIPIDSVKILNSIPEKDFIEYFDKKIKPMTAAQKRAFMLT